MKIKHLIIVIVLAAGVASSFKALAKLEPTCKGTGILCATSKDGTDYYKALDE